MNKYDVGFMIGATLVIIGAIMEFLGIGGGQGISISLIGILFTLFISHNSTQSILKSIEKNQRESTGLKEKNQKETSKYLEKILEKL